MCVAWDHNRGPVSTGMPLRCGPAAGAHHRLLAQAAKPANASKPPATSKPAVAAAVPAKSPNPTVTSKPASKAVVPVKAAPKSTCSGSEWNEQWHGW